ncbi:MAG: tyrosine-type recombinase/integrase [Methyloceanibacter sp.]
MCCRADGLPLQPQSLTPEFNYLASRVKDVVPRGRFHDLRHVTRRTVCSRAFIQRVAQEHLGHSTISTTLDLYSHVTDTLQSDAAHVSTQHFDLL